MLPGGARRRCPRGARERRRQALEDRARGVGIESQIFAEHNFFDVLNDTPPSKFISVLKGTGICVGETLVNGPSMAEHVDVLGAYNAVKDPDLAGDVGWAPTLYELMHPTSAVPALVWHAAGPSHVGGSAPGER